jgi:hypothetical protein
MAVEKKFVPGKGLVPVGKEEAGKKGAPVPPKKGAVPPKKGAPVPPKKGAVPPKKKKSGRISDIKHQRFL